MLTFKQVPDRYVRRAAALVQEALAIRVLAEDDAARPARPARRAELQTAANDFARTVDGALLLTPRDSQASSAISAASLPVRRHRMPLLSRLSSTPDSANWLLEFERLAAAMENVAADMRLLVAQQAQLLDTQERLSAVVEAAVERQFGEMQVVPVGAEGGDAAT